MSREIDERIVSMQFENRNFEKNANQSMSTLDKLKEKLNFKAAAKGVENLERATKRVDLSPIGKSVDNVGLRFNAMYTIADQTFRNIVNSAEATAKRLVSAFTIDPIKTGLSEYETKINAIQVIQSNTRGVNTMEDITEALDNLNTYADKTIYNFAQMTSNIGKFVAQGLDVQRATNAVQGMANLAAASGASAEDMSRATYQMSQALGGTIRKIDWNSLRNANMATVDLKNTLMDLARVNGIDIDSMIAEKGTFEDTLEKGWLSGDLFTEAMNIYSGVYDELELKSRGFTDDQVKNFMDLAKTAESAATEVKTFSQLMDVLKETAQSGWTQTWEEVIGDFESAKKTLTQVQVYFSNIIDTMSDARNFIVKHALNFAEPWEKMMEKLNTSGIGKAMDAIDDYTDKLQYFQDIMHSVWMGDYKNSDTGRYGLLDAAGYDHRVVQELVNISDQHYKSQGWKYQLTVDDIRAAHEKYGLTLDENTDSMKDTKQATGDLATTLQLLSDEQLEQAGLTKDEIKVLRELQKESERTGRSIEDIGNEMSTTTGRMLLIDSLKNVWSGLLGIFTAVGDAWKEIFPPIGFVQLYNAIKAVNSFSENLRLTDKETGELTDTAQKLQRIFKGIFAIFKIVTTFVGGTFKIAFKAVGALLNLFGTDILTVAAYIGDAAVVFSDWMTSLMDFEKIFKGLGNFFKNSWKAIKNWITGLKETDNIPKYIIDSFVNGFNKGVGAVSSSVLNFGKKIVRKIEETFGIDFSSMFAKVTPVLSKVVEKFKEWFGVMKESKSFNLVATMFENIFGSIKNWIAGLKNIGGTKDIAKYIIQGLINGLREGIKLVGSTILELGKNMISTIKEFLGIHSPSTVFFAIGGFIIAGLVGGLLAGGTDLWSTITTVGQKCIDIIKGMDIGAVLATVFAGGTLLTIFKLVSFLDKLATPLDGVNDILKSSAKVVGKFSKVLGSVSNAVNAFALKQVAIAIAILAGSIAVLALLPNHGKLWSAFGLIAALAGIMALLMGAMSLMMKLSGGDSLKTVGSFSVMLLSLAASMLILAYTTKILGSIDEDELAQGLLVLGAFMGAILMLMGITAMIGNGSVLFSLGDILRSIGIALLAMAVCVNILGKMGPKVLVKGILAVAGLTILIGLLIAATKIAGNGPMENLGGVLIKAAIAIGIMVICVSILGKMDIYELEQGLLALAAFVACIVILIGIASLTDSTKMEHLGKTLASMALVLGVMAAVVLICGHMSPEVMKQGTIALVGFMLIIGMLVMFTHLASEKQMEHLGKTLISMALAIGIMALVVGLMGLMKPETVERGLVYVGLLSLFIGGLLVATGKANENSFKTLIAVTAAIAVMAIAIGVLSIVPWQKMIVSVGAMVVMMAALTAMFVIISKNSSNADKAFKMIITLTAVMAVMGVLLILLSKMPWQNTLGAAGALTLIMVAMTGMLFVLEKMNLNVGKALKGILGLTAMTVPLRTFVAVLAAMQNVKNATSSILALTNMTIAMTLMLIPLALIGNFATNAIKGVVALTAIAIPLFAFVGVLAVMQHVKISNDTILALTNMVVAMSLMLIPLALIGKHATNAIKGVVALTAIAIPLLAFVGVLAVMQHVNISNDTILSLTNMVVAMTLMLIPLSIIGVFATQALLGAVALTAMAIPLLAFVGVLALMNKVENATSNAMLIITLMTVMTDCLVKISLVAPLAIIAVAAITALLGVITAFGLVVTAIGALNDLTDGKLEEFINTGIPLMIKMAEGLGLMIGKFITALAGEVMTLLPQLGLSLSQFMVNATPFILGAKLVDEKVLAGAGILAGAVLALTVADVINGIASFFTGGFAELGTELSQFMINATPFIIGASMLNSTMMAGVKSLAETVLILTAADILNGLTSWFTGGSSLAKFGKDIAALGPNMATFINSIGPLTEESVNKAGHAANIIKTLANAAKEIPNEGGWIAKLIGDNTIEAWSKQLPALGNGIKSFINCFTGANGGISLTDDHVNIASKAAEIVKTLAGVAKEIPNEGGWIAKIVGDNKLDTFAEKFPVLGEGIVGFISCFSDENGNLTLTDNHVEIAGKAAEIVKTLAGVAKEIPDDTSNSWVAKIVGKSQSLQTFAADFPYLGEAVTKFIEKLPEDPDEKLATRIDNGIKAIGIVKAVVGMITSLSDSESFGEKVKSFFGDDDAFETFTSNLPALGTAISKFAENIGTGSEYKSQYVSNLSGLLNTLMLTAKELGDPENPWIGSFTDNIKNLGDAIGGFFATATQLEVDQSKVRKVLNNLSTLAQTLSNFNTYEYSAIESLGYALKTVGKTAIDNFVNAWNDQNAKFVITSGLSLLLSTVRNGIAAKQTEVGGFNDSFKSIGIEGSNALMHTDVYVGYEAAGKYLCDGIISGMSAKEESIKTVAAGLGTLAVEAFNGALEINSPSKVFYRSTLSVGEGIVKSLHDSERDVSKAGSSIASASIDGARSILRKVTDVINGNIDDQPVITPVLDLSEVRSGASSISGLFSGRRTLTIDTRNVGITAASMTSRQNGNGTNDIVSSIAALRKDLANMPRESININGITYDDGSNIADAVQTLVRAARIERRV